MIPKLRFPEFTDNWTVTELGECSDIQTGKALPSSEILESGDRLICRGINVKSGFLESNSEINRFTNSLIDRKYLVQSDDILLPMDGSKVGKNIAVADLEFHNSFLIQRVARIRLPKELVWFYFQQLWSWNFERYVFTINTSSGIPHISEKQIRRFRVSKPSLEEAQKISSLFELVNKKINLLTKKKEALETYKKGLMQKIFSQELRFKREDGTDYPEWNSKVLSEVAEIQKGKQLNKLDMDENGAYPVLNGGINWSGFTTSYNTLANTVAISEGGNSCGYVSFITTNFWSGGHNYTLELQNDLDVKYLFHFLKYKEVDIMRLRVGSGLPNIQKKDLKRFFCDIPCLEEQRSITYILDNLDSQIDITTRKIYISERMKKGLLQQMFV